jgi:hypothetical protein
MVVRAERAAAKRTMVLVPHAAHKREEREFVSRLRAVPVNYLLHFKFLKKMTPSPVLHSSCKTT